MPSTWQLAAALTVALSACSTVPHCPDQTLRLDNTSDATAQRSFQRMVEGGGCGRETGTGFAMLKLNAEGVQSVHEVAQHPS